MSKDLLVIKKDNVSWPQEKQQSRIAGLIEYVASYRGGVGQDKWCDLCPLRTKVGFMPCDSRLGVKVSVLSCEEDYIIPRVIFIYLC